MDEKLRRSLTVGEIQTLCSALKQSYPNLGLDWPQDVLESMSLSDLDELRRRLIATVRSVGGVTQR